MNVVTCHLRWPGLGSGLDVAPSTSCWPLREKYSGPAVDRRRDGFPFGNREHFDFGVFACFGLAEVNWLFELVVLHSCCLDLRGKEQQWVQQ